MIEKAKVFGFDIIYYNRTRLSREEEERLGARYVSLDDLYRQSDVISLHCPMTLETHHLINRDTLAKMKKGVYIINTSRGKVIDETALVEALESGHVAGAGLDVFEEEPKVSKKLLSMTNVVLSAHCTAGTRRCERDRITEAAENALSYIKTGKLISRAT